MTCRTSKARRNNAITCATAVAKQTQWLFKNTLTRNSQPWLTKKLTSKILSVETKRWKCSKIDTKILSRKEESPFRVHLKIATMAAWFTRTIIRRLTPETLTNVVGRPQRQIWLKVTLSWQTLLGREASSPRRMLSLASLQKQPNSITTSPWVVTLKENWVTIWMVRYTLHFQTLSYRLAVFSY